MSGPDRVVFLPQAVYAYEESPELEKRGYCGQMHELYDEMKIKMKVPLQILNSLEEEPKPVSDYSPPQSLVDRFDKSKGDYFSCKGLKKIIRSDFINKGFFSINVVCVCIYDNMINVWMNIV